MSGWVIICRIRRNKLARGPGKRR